MVSMNANWRVYHGFPSDLYEPAAFDRFARETFANKLEKIGRPSECRSRTYRGWTLYDFRDAGLKLWYKPINDQRCEVDLIGPVGDSFMEMLVFTAQEAAKQERKVV